MNTIDANKYEVDKYSAQKIERKKPELQNVDQTPDTKAYLLLKL